MAILNLAVLACVAAAVNKHATVGGMGDDGERPPGDLATSIASWRATIKREISFCIEKVSTAEDCVNKPTTTELCSALSGETACKCAGKESDTGCNVGYANGATGRCAHIVIFWASAAEGAPKELFCKKMVLNDQWLKKGLLAPDTEPETKGKEEDSVGFHRCPEGYYAEDAWLTGLFSDGECHRKKRYLTETCWQAWGDEGTCVGSDTSHDEYSTACFQGTCVPVADVSGRYPCECSWWGWNLGFQCSAKDDGCNGHACTLDIGLGERFCNFKSKQNWHTIRSR